MVICIAPLTGRYSKCRMSVSSQSAGPTTAETRFWDRPVRDQGTRRLEENSEDYKNVRCRDLTSTRLIFYIASTYTLTHREFLYFAYFG